MAAMNRQITCGNNIIKLIHDLAASISPDGGHWTGLNKTDYQLTIENTYTSLPLVTGLY